MKKVCFFLILFLIFISPLASGQEMIEVDSYEVIDAKPGERVESNIYVTNPRDEPVDVEIWIQDWETSVEDGEIVKSPLRGAGVLDQSLAPFLELRSDTERTINPRETISIPFVTEVPKDKEGTYWTGIVVAQYISRDVEEVEAGDEGQLRVKTRAAFFSKIIRADSQDDNLKPWISYLSSPTQTENGLEFEATLENRGKVAFFFPSQLTIYEGTNKDENPIMIGDNQQEAVTQLAPFYLFPEEKIETKITLPLDLPPGVYTAKLKMLMERGEYAPVGWREFRLGE